MLTLKDLEIGSIDGRFEFVARDDAEVDRRFLRAGFVSEEVFDRGSKYFVYGMRGVGKTSLLRWLSSKKRLAGGATKFILFKSGITEAERVDISKAAGIEWLQTDNARMEFSQDYKGAWFWFVFHALGELIMEEKAAGNAQNCDAFLSLLGLAGPAKIEKTLGWLPVVKNAKVRFSGSLAGIEAELQGDLSNLGQGRGETTLAALNRRLQVHLSKVRLARPIHLFIDELEIFQDNEQQYDRDRRMIRDLIFVVSELNEALRSDNQSIYIAAAVRTEVLAALRSIGQEVERRVYDRGIQISWDPFVVSPSHPLLQMLRMKLSFSEERARERNNQLDLYGGSDILARYFPDKVHGQNIESYLLDRSLFRPRDIVQRLVIAKEMFPNEQAFTEEVLERTEQDYSKRLWQEVCYSLSAKYDDKSIRFIETLFAGREAYFRLDDMEKRARLISERSEEAHRFFERVKVADILLDLFMFGVVGNDYFAGLDGGGNIRNRWIYRGDQDLFLDKRMVLHRALWKRFNAVSSLERRSRSGDGPRAPRPKPKEYETKSRKPRRGNGRSKRPHGRDKRS